MYKRHNEIETPDKACTIWRYLSLEKFLSLINDRQLYFARQDQFFDIYEAELSSLDIGLFERYIPDITKEMGKEKLGCGFINSWVISDVELYLMWAAYSSMDKGIAIKTTVGDLIDSLEKSDNRRITISDVNYIDYTIEDTFGKANGNANLLARYFCKRSYFQQEKELRLVYYDYKATLDDKTVGLKFNVSLDTLINEIWISPLAKEWYEDLIIKELKLHNINKPVKKSKLLQRQLI